MQVTCLGRYAPFPPPGGAMNGYLVEHGDTAILLDAGNGVAPRLQQRLPIERLTAVVVSHLHEDHIADVHCLRFVQMEAQLSGRTQEKLHVYAPTAPIDQHRWLEAGEQWQELHTYDPNEPLVIGQLQIRFTCTNHPLPTYAMRITPVGDGGPVLFYTADTGESAAVAAAAHGADLMICEAALVEESESKRIFGHLTAAEAAGMAKAAGVKRTLLTHLWPTLDPQRVLDEARAVHTAVDVIEEGQTYSVD